jgi:hypothetical protein
MSKADALDLLMWAVTWFGGISVVTVAIAGFLSRYIAERSIEGHKAQLGQETERLKGELAKETETHKLRLRKQEIFYEREIDAASAFIALHTDLEPRYRFPDMIWDDVLDDVVDSFGKTEMRLRNYIAKYGAAISADNRNQISSCRLMASNNQFAKQEGEPALTNAKQEADEMLRIFKEIEDRFLTEIRA